MTEGQYDAQVDVVRRGYDALSMAYRADDAEPAEYVAWIGELLAKLGPNSTVLDLGCGCGIPVTRALSAAGHRVTGIDVSAVQIARARRLVPAATFLQADATSIQLPAQSLDAVVALYSIIHVPLAAQPALLSSIASWLAVDGLLLLSAGWQAWTGSDERWLGGDAPMQWSQADVATYRTWLQQCGFSIEREEFIAEGSTGHSLFLARRSV